MKKIFTLLMSIVLMIITGCGGSGTSDYWGSVIAPAIVSVNAPSILSINNTTFTEGIDGTFTVRATGTPNPTFALNGTLPTGVTFNNTSGILAGVPAIGTSGTYPLTITASNGFPQCDAEFHADGYHASHQRAICSTFQRSCSYVA